MKSFILLNIFCWSSMLIDYIHSSDINLNLKESNLKNLNDIEIYKDNVTKLVLSSNKIANIDLLVKFSKLKHLNLADNKRINKIDSLANLLALEYLDLSWNKIINIDSLANLVALEYLDLSWNKIINIDSLQKLTNLTTLKIAKNQIKQIERLIELKNLHHLDLSANNIKIISEYFFNNFIFLNTLNFDRNNINYLKIDKNHPNLKILRLYFNQISDLSNLELPFGLERIILANNQFQSFNLIGDYSQLKELDLSNNQIRSFNLIGNYSKLEILMLTDNQIEYLPANLSILGNLDQLYLSSNRFKNIDFFSQNFYNVKSLHLDDNQIEDIEVLNNLASIQYLTLSRNKIKNVDRLIKNTLFYIDLNDNIIDDICWIKNSINLHSVSLSNNRIKNLSCLHSASDLFKEKMIYFNLSYNEIENISSLINFTQISILYLDHNKIEDIKSLSNMKQMRLLSLNSNKLRNIESIRNLNKLKWLNLSENEIDDIKWIQNMSALVTFEISRNKINFIPNGLFDNIKYLSKIDLSYNLIKRFDCFGSNLANNLRTIYLNNNQLKHAPCLANFSILNEFLINNNNLEDINLFYYFSIKNLQTIDVSFNNIKLNDKLNFGKIESDLKLIFIDIETFKSLSNLINERLARKNDYFHYIKSLFIIINNQLDFVDCKLQLDYLKNMIHLNLFYSFQINNFLFNCNNLT